MWGGRERGNPHQAARAQDAQRGSGGGPPRGTAGEPPREGGHMNRRGAPSARKECGGPMQDRQSRGDPLNGIPRLTRAAIEGGKGRGKPLLSSARQRRTVGARGGAPEQTIPGPPAAGGDQVNDGSPPPQPRKQNACGKEEGGGPTAHAHGAQADSGRGGDPPVRQHVLPAHGMPEQEGGNPHASGGRAGRRGGW